MNSIFENLIPLTPDLKKAHWGDGEWGNESDIEYFKYRGFKCRIIRIAAWDGFDQDHLALGHLCGYVNIPKDNPLYSTDASLSDEKFNFIDVHRGLTFAEIIGDDALWIGFDCAHSGDFIPSMGKFTEDNPIIKDFLKSFPNLTTPIFNRIYKNMEFCKNECEYMVDQIIAGDTGGAHTVCRKVKKDESAK